MLRDNLYILGTRGVPAAHGGFETFAQDLAFYMADKGMNVTVYCQSEKDDEDTWNGIRRVFLSASHTAWGTAWFDLKAVLHCLKQPEGVWLTLGYNTGFLNFLPRLRGKKQIINMDGIEWKRGKWSWPYKAAFLFNYFCAGLSGNVLIADNPGISKLLGKHFKTDKIHMIPYGAHPIGRANAGFLEKIGVKPQEYGLIIARPEPENNLMEIVAAWSSKRRNKKLVVLGRLDPLNPYHVAVRNIASTEVLFPGAIYEAETVSALRSHAWLYFHGHSVGGTNPSLVESLSAGNAVIAHDNIFNRWTAGESAKYFSTSNELEILIDQAVNWNLTDMRQKARLRYQESFLQEDVLGRYADIIGDIQAGRILSNPCVTIS